LTEAERENLVAYLDNELEDAQARAVEAKIHLNPAVRAQADQMKRAWDLLDYLPRAEPRADFTCRTMDRLTALGPIEKRAHWKSTLAWAAVFLCVTAGGAAVCWLIERHNNSANSTEQDIAHNLRLLQHLPTYRWVNDIAQLNEISQPELFGDDFSEPLLPAGSGDITASAAENADTVGADKLAQSHPDQYAVLETRWQEFRSLPMERQDALRKLDRLLNQDQDTATRARQWRVLTRYVQWAGQLPVEDQRRLQNATRQEWKRLVRELRDRDWLSHQPQAVQERVAALPAGQDQSDEIGRLRKEERALRLAWTERSRPDADQRSPLTPGFLPEEVQNFVHDRLVPLLMPGDKKDFDDASHEGGNRYIRTLAKLTDRYAPASVTASIPKTKQQLAGMVDKELHKRLTGKDAAERPEVKALIQAEGRWPDFGIAAIAVLRQHRPKSDFPKWAHARPMDFEPAVQTFLDRQLLPALTPDEKKQLEQAEGQWPDYHRTMMKLAREHGMAVPGMSLPGAPEFWDQLATSLPDESDHLLLEFAAKLADRDLAGMQFSLTDRIRRERLKEEYYHRNPDRLQQRLLEDFQAWQRKG
jgi:hypothetical protein